jgi:di/tricarboxylate transporter
MTFWQRLWRVQLAGLISLAAFAAFLAILFVVEGLVVSSRETDVADVFLFVFGFSIFYGILPATLLGAPVYTATTSPMLCRHRQAAVDLGVSPHPLLMIVAVAAATAFLTPIGTTTNIMVYSPGGYRFTDHVISLGRSGSSRERHPLIEL